jgi:hypothetical protein
MYRNDLGPKRVKEIIKDQIEKYIKNEDNIMKYFMNFFNPTFHLEELKEVIEESFPQYLKLLNTIILLK